MTKLARKSWRVRVLRYASVLPEHLFHIDPKSHTFKEILKTWIVQNIPKDGDNIFKGKADQEEDDWLRLELISRRETEENDLRFSQEGAELWNREGQG